VTCDANNCITLIFNNDNTVEVTEIEDGFTFMSQAQYTISGNSLTFTSGESSSTLSFMLEGNRLTTIDDDESNTCTFTSIYNRQ